MAQFNVGDRVKCINPGEGNRVNLNQEYTIRKVEESYISVHDYDWFVLANRFELVAPAVVDEREEHTFYCVVYKGLGNLTLMNSSSTKELAEGFAETVRNIPNYSVLGLKKIKVKV